MPLGARNPRLVALRRLVTRRAERESTGTFVADGPILVAEALAAGLVEAVYVDVEAVAAPDGADVVASALGAVEVVGLARAQGIPVHTVAHGVLARIADPVTPQPVLAVVRRPPPPDPAGHWGDAAAVLVCESLADPGNVGTLVRVAEAAGMAAVWMVGEGTDPFAPKAVRASAGSIMRIPVGSAPGGPQLLIALAAAGFGVVGLRAQGVPYDSAPLDTPLAVVVGSEAHGISDDVAAVVGEWVGIPMDGDVESLNAGVAGAVVALEVARRRRSGSGPRSAAR